MQELLNQAQRHLRHKAIVSSGMEYDYDSLLQASDRMARVLLNGASDLNEQRVAFMVTPGFDYVVTMWAIWRAGGTAVPLCLTYPLPSLRYTIEDSDAKMLVVSPEFESVLADYAAEMRFRFLVLGRINEPEGADLPAVSEERRAMILYTSGTTSKPKGVVTTHGNIRAQIESLVEAWEWSDRDAVLNVLPLHHVHGIINVVSCALYSGACCHFLAEFEPSSVFAYFLSGSLNVFMAVPTIYHKLITYFDSLTVETQQKLTASMTRFRLMVSGSAALPVTVMQKWKTVSGHTLLERYGMTEIGMAISNPYRGERRPGCVGLPLPGVKIQLVDDQKVVASGPGEIWVQGKNVFIEYWHREEATREAFSAGWFKTGDIAVVDDGYYKIMGRSSVDIIKSGGYKISALEIEEVLRTHPNIRDCAVVGLENEEWGEIVAAAIVMVAGGPDSRAIDRWIRERLPAYRVPRQYKLVDELPRNAMGKVVKPEVRKLF